MARPPLTPPPSSGLPPPAPESKGAAAQPAPAKPAPAQPAQPAPAKPAQSAPDEPVRQSDDEILASLRMPTETLDYMGGDDPAPAPTAAPAGPAGTAAGDAAIDPTRHVRFDASEEQKRFLIDSIREGAKFDANWPRVICMKLAPRGRDAGALHFWAGSGMATIRFKSFQRSQPLHPEIVKNCTRQKPNRTYGPAIPTLWPEPPIGQMDGNVENRSVRGDCRGVMRWLDKISGRHIDTCPYGNCPRHPLPSGIFHSIWQAQRFIANLRTPAAISRYLRTYDPRPEVHVFGLLVQEQRRKREIERMGIGGTTAADVTF